MNERDLLEAGAVLPLAGAGVADVRGGGAGTGADTAAGAGTPDGDVLVARAYGHPALDERVVVRLVPEALGEAEDLALEFLGFGAEGSERVGRVRRQLLGFPAWALVHDPANGRHALAVVKEMERLARMAVTKPGHAKDGFDEIAGRLDRSVPHFLPTYYEQVARHFLVAESTTYASAFFGKAREAERRHALPVDEERSREVFLEFAAAGALSGKTLREQARGLAERLTPQDAFDQFRKLCLERAAAGLSPYAGMLEDLRRLARSAGRDVAAEEVSVLTELLPSGAIARAPVSFWKAARPALIEAGRRDPAVRVRLLRLLPTVGDQGTEFDEMWLATLESAGAFDLLAAGGGSAGAAVAGSGSADGGSAGDGSGGGEERAPTAAEWFSSWAVRRQSGYRRRAERMVSELRLVERFAAQLVREGGRVRLAMPNGYRHMALDLLDTCLAAGVPVVDPHDKISVDLERWLTDAEPGRRDLAATAADPRFVPILRAAVESLAGTSGGAALLDRVAADPVLGPVVRAWLADRADDLDRPLGLPGLHQQLQRLTAFGIPSVLAGAPDEAARIAATDPAPVLARTLRAGILDELGWPALDEAVERLRPAVRPAGSGPAWLAGNSADGWAQLEDAWPALVVAHDTHVAAVGPDEVLDERTLTLPAPKTYSWQRTTVRWSEGQWLIASGQGDERRATWSGRPADAFKPQGTLEAPWRGAGTVSLPVPGGGRFYGGRPMSPGDTSFGERRPVASDGISYWVLHEQRWWEYDPETARRGRASLPAFFDGALAEDVPDAVLLESASWLLPVQPGLEGSPFGSKDGRLGWWVRYDPAAGTLTACSVDGARSRALPCPDGLTAYGMNYGDLPLPPLRLPGALLHPVVSGSWRDEVRLSDADGLELGSVRAGVRGGPYAGGTALVPPLWYWHALRPRDEAGSAVLRAVTDEQAAELLAALADQTADAEAAVRRVLPGITHPALVRGVAALAAEGARAARQIAVFGEKAAQAAGPGAGPDADVVTYAVDRVLNTALGGLMSGGYGSGYYGYGVHPAKTATAMDQLRALHRSLAGPAAGTADAAGAGAAQGQSGPRAVVRSELRGTNVGWLSLVGAGFAAAAARAACAGTPEDERDALVEFLGAVTGGPVPFADPRGRLRTVELCEPRGGDEDRIGELRRADGRTMVIVAFLRVHDDRRHWVGVEYDPEGGFGPWEGFKLADSGVLGTPDDPERTAVLARLAELVRERGPVPYRTESAERFAELTGVDTSVAALLLLGLPGIDRYGRSGIPGPAALELAGLRPTRAATARDMLKPLSLATRIRLLARLVPADPTALDRLWEDGFDTDALAAEWLAIHGRQRAVPMDLMERADRETDGGGFLALALNPESRPELTGRTTQSLDGKRLTAEDPARLLSATTIAQYTNALRWLAYRLPYGDPLRAVLPETLRALRARLADPDLLLDPGVDWTSEGKPTAPRIREAYGLPETGGGDADGRTAAGPAIVLLPAQYSNAHEDVWLRPAPLVPGVSPDGGPGHPALALLTGLAPHNNLLRALRDVLSDDFAATVAADGPTGAAQDPRRVVPELVAAAGQRLGLSEDAAALYLMLLALPDPTDRNVTAWTDWKPAAAKRARAELTATDLVVEAKRARAGRTLFLPGGWLDRKAPGLPVENWKAALFTASEPASDIFVVPDCTVPELFRRAWQRVVDGDAPGFEEFTARRTGRGRR